jgi:hypothetical protein
VSGDSEPDLDALRADEACLRGFRFMLVRLWGDSREDQGPMT